MTESAVRKLISDGKVEGQNLEVKATAQGGSKSQIWKDKFALGVAGLMNRDGGDFVFGLETQKNAQGEDQIVRFSTLWAAGEVPEVQLRDVLQNRLDPPAAAGTVEVQRVAFKDQGSDIVCTAVRVPPWPHGIVGVLVEAKKSELDERNKRSNYSFPVRDGDKRRFLPLGEALMRSDANMRRTELQLLGMKSKTNDLVFSGGFHILLSGGLVPVHLPLGKPHARLNRVASDMARVAVRADVLTLLMRHAHQLNLGEAQARAAATLNPDDSLAVQRLQNHRVIGAGADHHVSLPLQLVRAVWEDQWSGQPHTCVALDGYIVSDGVTIRIVPR